MTSDSHRRNWLASLIKALGSLDCSTCLAYLNGISKYSWLAVSSEGEPYLDLENVHWAMDLGLHASSPLFTQVFRVTTSITEGRFQGRCPSCGRHFRYEYQPKSAMPGRLGIGTRAEPTRVPVPISQAPDTRQATNRPRVTPAVGKLPLRPSPDLPQEDSIRITSRPELDFSDALTQEHDRLLAGPPSGSDWSKSLEHAWTARWDVKNVLFQNLIVTPQALWLQLSWKEAMSFRSEVVALNRETGDTLFCTRGKHLLAANGTIALLASQERPKGFVAIENATGLAILALDSQYPYMSLVSRGLAASDPDDQHLVFRESLLRSPWTDLSEPGLWRVRTIRNCGQFFSVEYDGPGRRQEVRRALDGKLMWAGEYPGDQKVYVNADSHGWIIRSEGQIESFAKDGTSLASLNSREESLSMGPRFFVGRGPLGESSIWGCPEPALRAGERSKLNTRTLPSDLFPNRTCFAVAGDLLFCVCEGQKVLRAYDLASRKVVWEYNIPNTYAGKIQSLGSYGTDIFMTSKDGFVMVFQNGDRPY